MLDRQENTILSRYPFYSALSGAATLLILTIIGGAAFPEYNHATQFISELGASGAPHEYLARFAGFLGTGIFAIIYTVGAYNRLPRSNLSTIGLIGMVVYSMGYIGAVFFPCDPGCRPDDPSLSQLLHNLIGFAGYLASPAFLVLFGLESKRWPNSGSLPLLAFVCATAAGLGLLTFSPTTPWVGISQRLIEASVWVWIILSAKYIVFNLPQIPVRQ